MSLYVRVFTNFYTHRKTARLRLALGNDALWIPPRLWAYAAENQPDGSFADYQADEIAMLIGYTGDAKVMLEALLDVCLLDADMTIHGWREHNGYHDVFAARAKKAASARWKGKETDKTRKERKGKEQALLKHSSSMLQASEAIYAEYPRKVGKPVALKAILKALESIDAPRLLSLTKQFCAAARGREQQFIPHPATWFNQQRFNDDPSTWSSASPSLGRDTSKMTNQEMLREAIS